VSQLLLGVDGGATKTIALVADASGRVLGAGRAGSSDIHSEATLDIAIDHVEAAVRDATAAAGIRPRDVAACIFGLCGADWPEDVALYVESLRQRLDLGAAPGVTNDAFNSLRAGTDDGIGVALVMGTGGAVAARGLSGQAWFSGERMERAGAMEFGRCVYDLLIRGEYGAGPRPAFERAALDAYGADSVEGMIHSITRTGGLGQRSLARLAPVLLEASHAGDPLAGPIVRQQGASVAGYVRRAAERVGLAATGTRVVLAGGIFKHHGTDLRTAITDALGGYDITALRLEPVHGAVLMAADDLGLRPDTSLLASSGPEAGFFDSSPTSRR
jgi:N-acetylglucosamine kinase-like BadF-type ATPase